GACVRRRDVRFAKILDAGLEELRRAVALLAEDFAKVSIAARRSCLAGDVVEANRDREFRTQAQRLAGLTFGQEYAATKVLAGHVEKWIGRLQHADLGQIDITLVEDGANISRKRWQTRGHPRSAFCASSTP